MSKPVQSIERGMRMLGFIARADGAAGLGAIVDAAGVRASTARNILATLIGLGYDLGHRILNLVRIVGDDDALRRRFRPLLRTVVERFDESTYLIVPGGDEFYYLDGLELANHPSKHSRPGRREPLSKSAIGWASPPSCLASNMRCSPPATTVERRSSVRGDYLLKAYPRSVIGEEWP